jgi:hypothetical protein
MEGILFYPLKETFKRLNLMGLYIRGNRYYFKKQKGGKVYYKTIGLKKGQEHLLSERIKQVEDEIAAEHYGLEYSPIKKMKPLPGLKPGVSALWHNLAMDSLYDRGCTS